MKIKFVTGIAVVLLSFGIIGPSHAALKTIGAAQYNGAFYAMIYAEDLNLVWLDYTNHEVTWQDQMDWAASLNTEGALRYAWFPEYADFIWTGTWRLPDAHDQDGTGPVLFPNTPDSEMGYLYYIELGFKNYQDRGQTVKDDELNASEFNNLIADYYWSGTEHEIHSLQAWGFGMNSGVQDFNLQRAGEYGLAVRSGQFSAAPVPGTVWLLSSGLLGLVGLHRRRTEKRV